MGAKTKRRKAPSPIEQLDGPTEAQLANGDYGSTSLPDPTGGNRVAQVKINRGGTPIARWKRESLLTDNQCVAIDHCINLWARSGYRQKLTAEYGERIGGMGSAEYMSASAIDARKSLHKIIDYFPGPLRTYFGVFENICRFDMPAGVAGGELSRSHRTADARAHQVVCFVADIIFEKEKL